MSGLSGIPNWYEGTPDGWHFERSGKTSTWTLVGNERARAIVESDEGEPPHLWVYDSLGLLNENRGPYDSPRSAAVDGERFVLELDRRTGVKP